MSRTQTGCVGNMMHNWWQAKYLTKELCRVLVLVDALLACGHAVLRGEDHRRGVHEAAAHLDLVDRDAGLARVLFPPLRQRLVHLLQVIVPVRLLRLPVDAQVPGLLHRAQLDALEIEDLREAELRVGLVEVQYLEVLLLVDLQGRLALHLRDLLAGHVVDRRLLLLHARNVLLEARLLLPVLLLGVRGNEAEELRKLRAVRVVLEAAHEQELLELLVELLEGSLLRGGLLLVLLLARERSTLVEDMGKRCKASVQALAQVAAK